MQNRDPGIPPTFLIFVSEFVSRCITNHPIEGLLLDVGVRYKSDPKGSKIRFVLREVKGYGIGG